MVGNITLSLMVGKPAICCFVAIEKRHIAAALLLCPEDGTGAVQLSVVLSLAGNNGCSNGCTTADQHKDNQQSRVACVAGLWNGVLRCGRCSRCRCGLCCLVSVLVLQGSKGIFDSLCHGVNLCLLSDILAACNCSDGAFYAGEVFVVILIQGIRLGNGCIDSGVVGILVLQGGNGIQKLQTFLGWMEEK